jgi:Spy/CpxP family protein refolding chaperone
MSATRSGAKIRAKLSPLRWALMAALMLSAGPLFAQAETTTNETCPAAGACPHGEAGQCAMGQGQACQDKGKACMGAGKHGKGMHGKSGEPGPMAMFARMGEELGLTEPQKQELAALMEMYRPRIKELAQRGQESPRALMGMAPDDPAYNKLATELSEQAGASAAELVTLLTELQANAYALLTTEQQATFMAKRAEMRERMEKRQAEMEARREAGEPGYGPGFGMRHGMGHHPCKGCSGSEEDDEAQESAE